VTTASRTYPYAGTSDYRSERRENPYQILYEEESMNIIQARQENEVLRKEALVANKLISKSEVEVVRIAIEEGGTLPVHTTPVEVVFYILAGSGEVEIGEDRTSVDAGALVESPKNIPHALHNTSAGVFEVLVIKAPKP
jgi:quercetin dioxygenase-like cupin family protein